MALDLDRLARLTLTIAFATLGDATHIGSFLFVKSPKVAKTSRMAHANIIDRTVCNKLVDLKKL